MVQEREAKENHQARSQGKTPYERAVLGFRNYWYPACLSKHVTERKPKALMLLGDEVVLIRRQGKLYGLADECPHRGTRLSRGKHEFPGTPTISCRYHGWTYDVTNGNCVAALTDGPDSPVVGKVRVKTYPVEERKGIVWVWMGRMAPVSLEEDVPPLVLMEDTWVSARMQARYGNWRYHMENHPGHAFMLHRDSIHMLTTQTPAWAREEHSKLEEQGEDGLWLVSRNTGVVQYDEFPGLGRWPQPRFWRRTGNRKLVEKKSGLPHPVHGFRYTRSGIRLPGMARVAHAPITGCMFYEIYTPVDEDHYIYFQVLCYWPKSLLDRLKFYVKFYGYGRWAQMFRFTSQDGPMIGDSTDYAKRHGGNPPSKLYGPDVLNIAWIEYANAHARGEAIAPAGEEPERVTAASGSPASSS